MTNHNLPRKKFIFFERKIDAVAFAALIIAVVHAGIQLIRFIQGPDVILFAPERVMITQKEDSHGCLILRLSAVMTYINQGPRGQDDIVTKEYVTISVNNCDYDLKWEAFVNSTWDNKNVKIGIEKIVGAFPVKGNDVATHETAFYPYVVEINGKVSGKNFLLWNRFLEGLEKTNEILLTFRYETKSGKQKKKCCRSVLYRNVIINLREKGGSPVACTEIQCKMQ